MYSNNIDNNIMYKFKNAVFLLPCDRAGEIMCAQVFRESCGRLGGRAAVTSSF